MSDTSVVEAKLEAIRQELRQLNANMQQLLHHLNRIANKP